jgi:hypothetical protein
LGLDAEGVIEGGLIKELVSPRPRLLVGNEKRRRDLDYFDFGSSSISDTIGVGVGVMRLLKGRTATARTSKVKKLSNKRFKDSDLVGESLYSRISS